MNLFKEPTVVKKATPDATKPTVVPPEQKVSPPPRGRVSISMPFIFFSFSIVLFFCVSSRMSVYFILCLVGCFDRNFKWFIMQ